MHRFRDRQGRSVRLTDERLAHLEADHPEMTGQVSRIAEAVAAPDRVVRSQTDASVELVYKEYASTPVTRKFLCVVVKVGVDDAFVITAYYTDTVKRGDVLWETR